MPARSVEDQHLPPGLGRGPPLVRVDRVELITAIPGGVHRAPGLGD